MDIYEHLKNLLFDNYNMLFLLVTFVVTLFARGRVSENKKKYIWITVFASVALEIQGFAEELTRGHLDLVNWRLVLSVIGYCLRPLIILALIFTVEKSRKARRLLWIPELFCIVLECSAFFTKYNFWFDEEGGFNRGPLGYVYFAVPAFYFVYFIAIIIKRFSKGRRHEGTVLAVILAGTGGAAVLDIIGEGRVLNMAIVIATVFYYLYLNSRYSGVDGLTGLLNRESFYEDRERYHDSIVAMATFDMNGLKETNDTYGHSKGDSQLRKIGEALKKFDSKNVTAYRVGGDEFWMMFRKCEYYEVEIIVKKACDEIAAKNVSVSCGYEFKAGKSIHDTCKIADKNMYIQKAEYHKAREEAKSEELNGGEQVNKEYIDDEE